MFSSKIEVADQVTLRIKTYQVLLKYFAVELSLGGQHYTIVHSANISRKKTLFKANKQVILINNCKISSLQ